MTEQDNNNQPTGSYTPTTGNTVGVDNSPTQGDYARRQRPLPPMSSGPMQGASDVPATQPAPQRQER